MWVEYVGYLAALFTITAIFFIGKKQTRGWLFGMVGDGLWMYYGMAIGAWPVVVINVVILAANVKGYWEWRKAPPV